MTEFAIRRMIDTFLVMIGVSVVVFLMLHLVPGDPAQVMLGETGHTAAQVDQLREQLGLNDPLPLQYWNYISRAVRGDLGHSLYMRSPVATVIAEQFPATAVLALTAMAVAIVLGVISGVIAALRHNTWVDGATMFVALLGVSAPNFWLGLVFIMVFSFQLGWFPATGTEGLSRLVLPAATLGFSAAGIVARMVRSSLLDVLSRDYVRTARAKGLNDRRVAYKHALKNAMIPAVTIVGLQFGSLIGGSMVIEIVFSRQGIGRLAVTAILNKDYPLVQGVVMLAAGSFVVINTLVDLAYAWLDPRIRYT